MKVDEERKLEWILYKIILGASAGESFNLPWWSASGKPIVVF